MPYFAVAWIGATERAISFGIIKYHENDAGRVRGMSKKLPSKTDEFALRPPSALGPRRRNNAPLRVEKQFRPVVPWGQNQVGPIPQSPAG
jgi:hypothetical protein